MNAENSSRKTMKSLPKTAYCKPHRTGKVARDIQEYKTFIPCLKSSTTGQKITSRTEMEQEIQQFYSKLLHHPLETKFYSIPVSELN
uniref:Uncharacterized protein n=1 Tax=Caenorhabditis japonica TaxID=281687 RepID=A0A8R1IL64_CAEJA